MGFTAAVCNTSPDGNALAEKFIPAITVLFLDDFEGNITAAQALGIDGLLVTENEEKTIADLQKALAI